MLNDIQLPTSAHALSSGYSSTLSPMHGGCREHAHQRKERLDSIRAFLKAKKEEKEGATTMSERMNATISKSSIVMSAGW